MLLVDIMKENEINPNWIFTHVRLHGKEGLFFFEPVIVETEDGDEQSLDTKCILVDDAVFNYSDDMEREIEINVVGETVIFSRIDGKEIAVPKSGFEDMPFKLIEFSKTLKPHTKPTDFVEVE